VLYTGSGSSRNVVGVGFTPDLVWVKSRTNTEGHIIFDSVRGPEKRLLVMNTAEEAIVTTGGVMSFDSDGYSTAQYTGTNQSGQNYVAWCWRAGAGTTSTNTNGSITSVVSANQDAGFSIVSYTGNNSSPVTIGHGLGKTPAFIIVKNRDVTSTWYCYHKSLGATKRISLESTADAFSGTGLWNSTEPSSTVFTTVSDTATNNNGSKHIAYCWAEIEGYSKFGSYTGNGSTDGPFVFTNGKPAWVMIKRTDSSENWYINDSSRNSSNVTGSSLMPNLDNIEATIGGAFSSTWDMLSNGFKLRDAGAGTNASGGTYIYACWMESPFQTANAK
jgi:hypothetical protein